MSSPPFDAERLTQLGRVTSVAISPDDRWLAVAVSRLVPEDAKYVSDLWRVPLDGTKPTRLTFGNHNDRAPCFRRDGSLGFLSNRTPREGKPEEGDEERSQVWIVPVEGGDPRPITDEPLGVSGFKFACRGNRLVVVADVLNGTPHEEQRARGLELSKKGPSALHYTEMPVRYWDHWFPRAAPHWIAYDEHGAGRRDLTPGADREHREGEWDLSDDGSAVVITYQTRGPDRIPDRALRWIDTATARDRILGAAPRTRFAMPRFSHDAAHVACARHVRKPDAYGAEVLCVVEVHGGTVREVATNFDRWLHPAAWSNDGSKIVATADDRGTVPVFTVDVASGEVVRITSAHAAGSHEGISLSADGTFVVGTRSRIVHPPEPFRVELAADAEPEVVARLSGFDPTVAESFVEHSSHEIASDDGTKVQYFMVQPKGVPDRPRPTLLFIHGGPRNQWADVWHWRWNALIPAAHGYAVALPNPRGSTGFGQQFVEGIWPNAWGGQCYRDVMAVADAVASTPGCDATRMCAMGGSFGGYMTSWIGANTDRFQCLITHAGLYALSAFHGVTDLPAWWGHEMSGHPYGDTTVYDRYSPHRRVANWKTPTLVIHGEKDYRVPISEALALFEALQHHGVPSELLVFPDENHWILKPRNTVAWYRAVLDFLGRHLTPG